MKTTTYLLQLRNHGFLGLFVAVLCFLSLFSYQAKAQTNQTNYQSVTELYDFNNMLFADEGSLKRYYFIQNSPERRERLQQFYTKKLTILNDMEMSVLSTGGQVDFVLLQRYLKDQLVQLAKEKAELKTIDRLINYALPIYELEKLRRRGNYLDSKKVALDLDQVREEVENRLQQLNEGKELSKIKLTPALAKRANITIKFQIKALQSVFDFYKGYDPQFSWWVEKPNSDLISSLKKYQSKISTMVDSTLLPKDDGSGIIGNPVGKKGIESMLEYEMIAYSPEQLIDIANQEFAWCDQEVLKVSKEMGFGKDWKKALEKVKNTYVEEGHQPETMLRLYDESIAFLKEKDLVTIPAIADETWRMTMISPERQKKSPFFLGGEVLQIAYPTNDMEHEYKMMSMRGNNPHFARAVIHHELIAGHHLQMFSFKRHKPYRDYYTPFWVEGWALYWEMLLWDQGFAKTPEDKLGMLFWRMHRCARIIFSLNYHLEKWTPQQCIDFLVDRVGHERANAEGEVRRSFTGGYGPLYQIAYMTGGLQFSQLRKELVDGGKMSHKEFHDAVLMENSMPVEMVRALLTNQNLTKNYKSNWRFYNFKK